RARNLHRGVFSQIRTCRRGSIVGFAGIFMRDATAKVDAALRAAKKPWFAVPGPHLARHRYSDRASLRCRSPPGLGDLTHRGGLFGVASFPLAFLTWSFISKQVISSV